jgi:uncharacterized membrane protein
MKNANELVELLKQHELINSIELNPSEYVITPWYIKILMGFCGWLAAIFTLGLLGMGIESLFDSAIGLSVLGVLMIAGSFAILSSSKSEFVEHLGLAVSFAGQGLIAFALFTSGGPERLFSSFSLTLMCCFLAFLMPSYIHRMMSAYFATLCLSYFMSVAEVASFFSSIVLLFVALMWLYEFTFSHQVRKLQSVAYGAVFGLIQFKTSILFARHGQTWAEDSLPNVNQWIDEGLNVLVLLYIIHVLVKHKKILLETSQKWLGLAVVLLLCIGTFYANGIVSGILILVIGFAIQNKALLVLGILSAIVNLSSYYYLLDITLLNKSFILGGLGVAGLILAYMSKRLPNERSHHEN